MPPLNCLDPAGENAGRSVRTQAGDREHVMPQNRFAAPVFIIGFCVESGVACPLMALSGRANRAGPRLLSVENRKTFGRPELFRF